MTREMAKELVKNANERIDNYINNQLPVELGYKAGDKIPATEWFKAQELINAQKFYETNYMLLKALKADGFDVKINMQNNKLVF